MRQAWTPWGRLELGNRLSPSGAAPTTPPREPQQVAGSAGQAGDTTMDLQWPLWWRTPRTELTQHPVHAHCMTLNSVKAAKCAWFGLRQCWAAPTGSLRAEGHRGGFKECGPEMLPGAPT